MKIYPDLVEKKCTNCRGSGKIGSLLFLGKVFSCPKCNGKGKKNEKKKCS